MRRLRHLLFRDRRLGAAVALAALTTAGLGAQAAAVPPAAAPSPSAPPSPSAEPMPAQLTTDASGAPLPADYIIGPNDVLTVRYWREDNLSAEVSVRPDGKISLPLLNDVQAAGLTPDALRLRIVEAAAHFVESPVVSVNVKEIKSRKVYITGMVAKPGEYALVGPTTVMQLIAVAGGLLEYADSSKIVVLRPSEKNLRGDPMSFNVSYKDISRGRNLRQNIDLKPGDTVIVP